MKQPTSLFGINDCHKPKKSKSKNKIIKKKTTTRKIMKETTHIKNIILFPHGLGQTKLGVDKAPQFIKKFINPANHIIQTVQTSDFFTNLKRLYKINNETIGPRINIGGDHSMAIATIAYTMNKYPNAKVIYFDAHADINTYKSSNSKHYHGMPLSFVTGLDTNPKFSFIHNKLPFSNLFYVGSRCWDIFEVNTVYKNNIQFLEPVDINNHLEKSIKRIMDFVGDSPVHISFDVDSIDPKYIPSTGTPVKNGIVLKNAMAILDILQKYVVNMDITELNMDIGSKSEEQKSGKNTIRLFKHFLQ